MRPVKKWPTGHKEEYNPPATAKSDLENNIGPYCSYCEERQSSLAVEHVISIHQDHSQKVKWVNFLLSCSRCNGQDNKGHQHVDFLTTYFPHLDNTFFAFQYLKGGVVRVNPAISDPAESAKASSLMKLVGLDKFPGNQDYAKPHPVNDSRWNTRSQVWDFIETVCIDFQQRSIDPIMIANEAAIVGHFSIWYTLFQDHPDVLQALIDAFKGTARDCFDPSNQYLPIARSRA